MAGRGLKPAPSTLTTTRAAASGEEWTIVMTAPIRSFSDRIRDPRVDVARALAQRFFLTPRLLFPSSSGFPRGEQIQHLYWRVTWATYSANSPHGLVTPV